MQIGPAVQHPKAARGDLGRSEAEGAQADEAMENEEREGPADLPCPEHPWSKIAVQRIAVNQSISNGVEHLELTRLDPQTPVWGGIGPPKHRSICFHSGHGRRRGDTQGHVRFRGPAAALIGFR